MALTSVLLLDGKNLQHPVSYQAVKDLSRKTPTLAGQESVLIVATIPPMPARANGLSIRYTPIIQRMAQKYNVDVCLILDQPIESEFVSELNDSVRHSTVFVRERKSATVLKRMGARLRSLMGLTVPATIFRYDKDEILSVFRSVSNRNYSVVVVTDSTLAGLVRKAFPSTKLIIDAIDSRYLLFKRQAKQSIISRIEANQMLKWERELSRHAACVTYISEFDRRSVYGSRQQRKVVVIPNGVYEDDFAESSAPRTGFDIVFLGHMAYRPNIIAAERAARILQRVQTHFPSATLTIVGRSPSDEVKKLAHISGVRVTGTVPSIWPYLENAALCLFPMEEGAGQQNKLLEAMRASAPVVTTPVGNLGVCAAPGTEVLVGESDDELVSCVAALLGSEELRRSIGTKGRDFVGRMYSWRRSWSLIEEHWLR